MQVEKFCKACRKSKYLAHLHLSGAAIGNKNVHFIARLLKEARALVSLTIERSNITGMHTHSALISSYYLSIFVYLYISLLPLSIAGRGLTLTD